MKSKIYSTTIVTLFILMAAGCASTSTTSNTNVSVASNTAVNSPVPAVRSAESPGNATAEGPLAGNSSVRGIPDGSGPQPGQKKQPMVAPEDSTVSTTSENDGTFVETRTFNSDPVISKLTKTTKGTQKSAKIFLKNGKVIPVSADEIQIINVVPLAFLKKLAGVPVPTSSAASSDSTTDKPKR